MLTVVLVLLTVVLVFSGLYVLSGHALSTRERKALAAGVAAQAARAHALLTGRHNTSAASEKHIEYIKERGKGSHEL